MPATHRYDQEFAPVGPLGEVPLATLGGRLLARFIDTVILFVPTYLLFALLLPVNLWVVLGLVLVEFPFYDAMLTASTGATPGKRMARIRVVRLATGEPPGWGTAAVRALVHFGTLWVVTALFVLFDERTHRGLHDRVAGTIVIAV